MKRSQAKEELKENQRLFQLTEGRIENSVAAAKRRCTQYYGFASDPHMPLWINVNDALLNMNPRQYFARPSNMAYHNMCTTLVPPPGVESLLGLGHKFCIQSTRPKSNTTNAIFRFIRQVRLQYWLTHDPAAACNPAAGTGSNEYIPKLYVKSSWNPPHIADGNTELAMMAFANRIEALANSTQRRRPSNLSPAQHRLIRAIKADRRFIVCLTDKNLGPAILERAVYIRRAFQDHLGNANTYRALTSNDAEQLMEDTASRLKALIARHRSQLPYHELTYFERSFGHSRGQAIGTKPQHRTPLFYLTLKVHKNPWSTRPVVSCIGSFVEIFSKWLDYQLNKLLPLSPTYLRDSNQVLEELEALGPLPRDAKLFTADAVSMYTNIDTRHALTVYHQWFRDCSHELPTDFPTELFLNVLEIVMTRNVFSFDDTYWLQIAGTAMGTSTACMYATMYYAKHERTSILPTYGDQLLYFKRFIDDIIGIWTGGDCPAWTQFRRDLSFGSLQWETSMLSNSVVYLDLEISIDPDSRRLTTRTYQKPMNLFLYIPPTSAHAPGVLKSIVFGNLQRFWRQNTHRTDFVRVAGQFAQHLIARGHHPDIIRELFLEVGKRLSQPPTSCENVDPRKTLFFHWEYHPNGISRRDIRRAYEETCAGDSGFNFDRFVVAFSRAPNIRDALMPTRLSEPAGSRASDHFSELPELSDPNCIREV